MLDHPKLTNGDVSVHILPNFVSSYFIMNLYLHKWHVFCLMIYESYDLCQVSI